MNGTGNCDYVQSLSGYSPAIRKPKSIRKSASIFGVLGRSCIWDYLESSSSVWRNLLAVDVLNNLGRCAPQKQFESHVR